jgi:hypothetical protein
MKTNKKIIGMLADKMQEKTGLSRKYILGLMITSHYTHGDTEYIYAHLRDGIDTLRKNNDGNNISVSVSEKEIEG